MKMRPFSNSLFTKTSLKRKDEKDPFLFLDHISNGLQRGRKNQDSRPGFLSFLTIKQKAKMTITPETVVLLNIPFYGPNFGEKFKAWIECREH